MSNPTIRKVVKASAIEVWSVQRQNPNDPDEWHGWGTCPTRQDAVDKRNDYQRFNPEHKFRAVQTITTILVLEVES